MRKIYFLLFFCIVSNLVLGQTSTKLTGTVIGVNDSYSGTSADDKTAAFDGDINTFFDWSSGESGWAGLDLGGDYTITEIRFYPRAGFASRMQDGYFEGSSTADFSQDVVMLGESIFNEPSYDWNVMQISASTPVKYVRYVAPAGGYVNVAEVEFYGYAATQSNTLTGTVIGVDGSYSGTSSDDKLVVFDGNTETFFDWDNSDGAWAGLDLGSNHIITGIRYFPRIGFESRMQDGYFEGSSTPDFTDGVVFLGTIFELPMYDWNSLEVTETTPVRYVRYVSPSGGYGNVAEVEFTGYAVMPITLSSFSASVKESKYVALNWTSAAESNFSGFEVERQSGSNSFEKVATVAGKGASSYQFIDYQPSAGTNLYRLKMVDLDGTFTVSNMVSATIKLDNAVASVYPNPIADNFFTLNLGKSVTKGLDFQIFDQAGRTVKRGTISKQVQRIDLPSLSSGIYMIKIADGTSLKLVKK